MGSGALVAPDASQWVTDERVTRHRWNGGSVDRWVGGSVDRRIGVRHAMQLSRGIGMDGDGLFGALYAMMLIYGAQRQRVCENPDSNNKNGGKQGPICTKRCVIS